MPFLKVTVPVGVPLLPATVPVKVTGWRVMAGLAEADRATERLGLESTVNCPEPVNEATMLGAPEAAEP